jgi:peroxiredoxin
MNGMRFMMMLLLPHPGVFVIGKDGVIRFAHVNPDYKTRLDPEAILKAAIE